MGKRHKTQAWFQARKKQVVGIFERDPDFEGATGTGKLERLQSVVNACTAELPQMVVFHKVAGQLKLSQMRVVPECDRMNKSEVIRALQDTTQCQSSRESNAVIISMT